MALDAKALRGGGLARVDHAARTGEQAVETAVVGPAKGDDGRAWSALEPLPVNSASDDFAPRLVRAEDGSLRLFWLSSRRGLGWEIWNARQPAGGRWSDARRVPLESLVPAGLDAGRRELATDLLGYGVRLAVLGLRSLLQPPLKALHRNQHRIAVPEVRDLG